MPPRIIALALAFILQAPLIRSQESAPSRPSPPTDDEVTSAIAQGTKILIGMQENYLSEAKRPRRLKSDEEKKAYEEKEAAKRAEQLKKLGPPKEWPYEGVYRLDTGDIAPGYRVGGTAIVCMAMLAAPGFAGDPPRRDAFLRGLEFMLGALETDPLLKSGFEGTYDVRGWGHAYGLMALLDADKKQVVPDAERARTKTMARKLIRTLEETEIPGSGGWNYARGGSRPPPSTFMTASTLQALFEARAQAYDVNPAMVERALKVLEVSRLETGAILYTTKKTGTGFDEVPGACARMAICETTLLLARRSSVDRVRFAVNAFFENWQWLEKRRKQPKTHEPPYMIAPYYFHFGHTYVAQAIEQLPEAERPALRSQLRALYWKTREPDGGWNDRIFPRSEGFGTAMTMLGLLMPTLPPPASWKSA